MKNYSLIPLKVAEHCIEKNIVTHMWDAGKEIRIPVCLYYIEGPKENILIDSGLRPYWPPMLEKGGFSPGATEKSQMGSWETCVDGLAKIGLKPDDIDIIIISHTHCEHMGFVKEWKNARFIIQKDEYEFAMNPIPAYRYLFLPETLYELERHPAGVDFVDGDAEIVEGVNVFKIPGHTPGMQAVTIESAEGLMVYASDLINVYHNIYPMDEELGTPCDSTYYIPPGYFVNMWDCFASVDRIKAVADIIIPGHEPRVLAAGKIPPAPYIPAELRK